MTKKLILLTTVIIIFGCYFYNLKNSNKDFVLLEDINDIRELQTTINNDKIEKQVEINPSQARVDEVKRKGNLYNRTKQPVDSNEKPIRNNKGAMFKELAIEQLVEHMPFYDNTLFFDQQEQIRFEDSDFKNRKEVLNYKNYVVLQLAPKNVIHDFFKSNALGNEPNFIKKIKFPRLMEDGTIEYRNYECYSSEIKMFKCKNINFGTFYGANNPTTNFKSSFDDYENSIQYYELSDSGQFLMFVGVE